MLLIAEWIHSPSSVVLPKPAGAEMRVSLRPRRSPSSSLSISRDRGLSWEEPYDNAWLIEPVCQASILRYTGSEDPDRSRILFSNPASGNREAMAVRLSYDEGYTWPYFKWLHLGPSAYSDMVVLPDHSFGLLYERGDKSLYENITFASLTLDWLTDGRDFFENQ